MEIEIKITKDGVSKSRTFIGYDSAMSNVYTESLEHLDKQRKLHPEKVVQEIHLG